MKSPSMMLLSAAVLLTIGPTRNSTPRELVPGASARAGRSSKSDLTAPGNVQLAAQLGTACLCHPQAAENVGILLTAASPLHDVDEVWFREFQQGTRQQAFLYQAGSPTIVCADRLGAALIRQGLASFERDDYYNAYNRVIELGGDIEAANDAGWNAIQSGVDATLAGQELRWLARVLPAAANGDWGPYINQPTQWRKYAREQLRLMIGFGGALGVDLSAMLEELMSGFPTGEQTMILSCHFGN